MFSILRKRKPADVRRHIVKKIPPALLELPYTTYHENVRRYIRSGRELHRLIRNGLGMIEIPEDFTQAIVKTEEFDRMSDRLRGKIINREFGDNYPVYMRNMRQSFQDVIPPGIPDYALFEHIYSIDPRSRENDDKHKLIIYLGNLGIIVQCLRPNFASHISPFGKWQHIHPFINRLSYIGLYNGRDQREELKARGLIHLLFEERPSIAYLFDIGMFFTGENRDSWHVDKQAPDSDVRETYAGFKEIFDDFLGAYENERLTLERLTGRILGITNPFTQEPFVYQVPEIKFDKLTYPPEFSMEDPSREDMINAVECGKKYITSILYLGTNLSGMIEDCTMDIENLERVRSHIERHQEQTEKRLKRTGEEYQSAISSLKAELENQRAQHNPGEIEILRKEIERLHNELHHYKLHQPSGNDRKQPQAAEGRRNMEPPVAVQPVRQETYDNIDLSAYPSLSHTRIVVIGGQDNTKQRIDDLMKKYNGQLNLDIVYMPVDESNRRMKDSLRRMRNSNQAMCAVVMTARNDHTVNEMLKKRNIPYVRCLPEYGPNRLEVSLDEFARGHLRKGDYAI